MGVFCNRNFGQVVMIGPICEEKRFAKNLTAFLTAILEVRRVPVSRAWNRAMKDRSVIVSQFKMNLSYSCIIRKERRITKIYPHNSATRSGERKDSI